MQIFWRTLMFEELQHFALIQWNNDLKSGRAWIFQVSYMVLYLPRETF